MSETNDYNVQGKKRTHKKRCVFFLGTLTWSGYARHPKINGSLTWPLIFLSYRLPLTHLGRNSRLRPVKKWYTSDF